MLTMMERISMGDNLNATASAMVVAVSPSVEPVSIGLPTAAMAGLQVARAEAAA
jgi:hypothetical protein